VAKVLKFRTSVQNQTEGESPRGYSLVSLSPDSEAREAPMGTNDTNGQKVNVFVQRSSPVDH